MEGKSPVWQQERPSNFKQRTVVAIEMEVVTYQEHLDVHAPGWENDSTPERAINSFDEDLDLIIQPALIGNARKTFERNDRFNDNRYERSNPNRYGSNDREERPRSPFIIDGAVTYKKFAYRNWEQIIERIVTQKGFAESQNIFFAKRGSGSFGSQASQPASQDELEGVVAKFERKGSKK